MSLETRLKRNFTFNATELHEFVLTGVLISIIMFMFVWRVTSYDLLSGIIDFIGIIIFSFLGLFVFVGGIKFFAIGKGYFATYSYWLGGLLSGFLVSFIALGYIPIIFPGVLNLKSNDRLRHGQEKIGENKQDIFWILASGLITSVLFSFILLIIYSLTGIELIYYGALLNAFIAFFAVLPFPNNIGLHMFYMKKKFYYYFFGLCSFVLFIAVSKTILNTIVSFVILLLGFIIIRKFFVQKFNV